MISYHRRYQENTTLLNLLKYIFDILMVILTAYVLQLHKNDYTWRFYGTFD